jgi:hypothetical protein
VTFNNITTPAADGTAHGFSSSSFQCGLADGSARSVSTNATGTFTAIGPPAVTTASVWSWAICVNGPIGNAPTPNGW